MKGSKLVKDRIIQLINEKNMSINAVCMAGGLTTSTLNTMLNNKSEYCSLRTLIKVCQGLNITLYEFFNDERFKNIDEEN